MKRSARDLRSGDRLFFTLETVVRTFVDRLTDEGRISITLERGNHVRTVQYRANRKIKLLAVEQ